MNELRQFWNHLPFKAYLGVLIAAWVLLFHWRGNTDFGYTDTPSLFRWLWVNWNGNPDDEIGMFVPLLAGALLYIRREHWIHRLSSPWIPGLVILLAGIAAHLLGYMVQQTRLSIIGFLLGLFGILGMIWGWRFLRAAALPLGLLIFMIPFAALLSPISNPLRRLVTWMAAGFCSSIFNVGVQRNGVLLFDTAGTFQFEVAPACSGINSLTAMFLLTVAYSFLNLKTGWRRLLLIACAIPLAVLSNWVRLVTIIVVADSFGQKHAAAIENKFGFITFLVGLAGVFSIGWLLREPNVTPGLAPQVGTPCDVETPRHLA